ncbi:MAG TPA: alpha/beta hydrolase [Candidatus Limnocylindrales bacterium]|nr:alpha/beta hydrolase [Candidatus Limnocylindrales bacterium]
MNGDVAVGSATISRRSTRFRRAEEALWRAYGLRPVERYVDLPRPRLRLRVLEIGTGRPILLVHGTVGPAAWAPLVEALPGAGRFIVLDRPGWGGSDATDFGRHPDYHAVAADILAGVLDGLEIDRAAVIGGSIGDVWALSLAEHDRARVDRLVLLGPGPLRAEVPAPPVVARIASPLGALVVRLPMTASIARSMLSSSGHAASLAAGRIPDALLDYRVALSNDTAAMRHERDMIRAVLRGRGWRPDLPFGDETLGRIATPTLFLYGTNDGMGDVATWRRFAAAMPNARLEVVEGAGHMVWFDEPRDVASRINRFLTAGGVA